jgi:hypothetical protein
MHRPEFEQAERLSVPAGALLHEEDGPGRVDLHEQGDQRQKRRHEDQTDDRRHDADQSCGYFCRPVIAESLGEDQCARTERLDGHFSGDPLIQLDRIVDIDAADAGFQQ